MVVASEALEADDADRPRPEAALAREATDDRLRRLVVEPLQVERAAEPDEGSTAPTLKSGPVVPPPVGSV